MAEPKRTTVYLDKDIHKALKLKALELEKSVSELIEDYVKHHLAEDLEDINTIKSRKKEKSVSYDTFLSSLKKDGLI
jgi:molybdopterin converting factor small subunit